MKKFVFSGLLCVIFLFFSTLCGSFLDFHNCQYSPVAVSTPTDEQLTFTYNGRIFDYFLKDNIKTSSQFDLNYEFNKYNRFTSREERIDLLKHMLDLGFDKEIALDYIFPNLSQTIKRIEKNVSVTPKDAKIEINTNTEKVFLITTEVVGIELDKVSLINQIVKHYINQKTMNFELPLKKIQPTTTKKDLEKTTCLLGDFSTNISNSNNDRKHNIKNALMSLNKVEIAPNQIFSFNKIVGRRTAENGYREAKIIVNNEFVDGLGGGVCQVSTTLYNTALLSGLEIVEANKHSKQVSYVKAGFDAMVNFGSSDLKFRNNTSEKITIITNYSPSTARIRIFGMKNENTYYKLTNEILNIVEPKEDVFIDEKQEHLDKVTYQDEFFYLKKASKGMEIKSYREKYINNQLVSKELLRHDKYKVQDAVKIYGSILREQS